MGHTQYNRIASHSLASTQLPGEAALPQQQINPLHQYKHAGNWVAH